MPFSKQKEKKKKGKKKYWIVGLLVNLSYLKLTKVSLLYQVVALESLVNSMIYLTCESDNFRAATPAIMFAAMDQSEECLPL